MHSFKVRFRLYDLLFYLLLVFSFYYTRNMLCRLMMVTFFGYTLWRMFVEKRKIPLPFFYISFFAFVFYGAANIFLGNAIYPSVARSMVVSLGLSFLMVFSIVEYIYMTNDAVRVLRVTELGIFTTAFVVVMLSIRTITQGRLGGGTEINSNMLAILCVYGFVLTMYLRKVGKVSQISNWAKIGFYVLAILLSGSRKGLVMVVLAVLVVRFAGERKKLLKNILIGVGVIGILYVLIMNVPVLYDIIGVRVENMLASLSGETSDDSSLEDREKLVELGWKYIQKNPWIGYGYDCFKMVSGRGPNGKVEIGVAGFYSHNNYIELLFGGGIIALVLYYIGILDLLIKLLRKLRKDICIRYLLAILVSKLSIEYYYVSSYERIDAYILAIVLGCVLIVDTSQNCRDVGAQRKEVV